MKFSAFLVISAKGNGAAVTATATATTTATTISVLHDGSIIAIRNRRHAFDDCEIKNLIAIGYGSNDVNRLAPPAARQPRRPPPPAHRSLHRTYSLATEAALYENRMLRTTQTGAGQDRPTRSRRRDRNNPTTSMMIQFGLKK